MRSRTLSALSLLFSLLFASAARAVDWQERPLHEDVPLPTSNGFARAVATDGRNFLVASERFGHSPDGAAMALMAATLMDAQGHVLRETALPIAPRRMTWSGEHYVVFGDRQYAGVSADGVYFRIRRYPAGVEWRDFLPGVSAGPPAASNGRRSLVVLSRIDPALVYVGLLIDEHGEVAGEFPAPFDLNARGVRVASDGDAFAFTWYVRASVNGVPTDSRYLAIYDDAGAAVTGNIEVSTGVDGDADLVSDGHTFGVFPTGSQPPHPVSLFGTDGTLVRQVTIPARTGGALDVAGAFPIGGSGYYVNGQTQSGAEGWFLRGPSYEPESAGNGAGPVVGYASAAGRTMVIDHDSALIVASKDDVVANALHRVPIFFVKPQQNGGTAALNASGTALVVWQQGPSDQAGRLYAVRVSPTGVPLDRDPIDVGPACHAARPAVSSDGEDFLVSWLSCTSILGARVSSRGTLLDPVPLTLAAGGAAAMRPSAAFDGANHVVAWQNAAGISVARVSPGGSLLDLPGRTFEGTWPLVAPAPDGVLLAYLQRSGAPRTGYIVTQRLDRALTPFGAAAAVSANWKDIQPAWLERAGDRYLLTFSVAQDDASRSIHAAQWLSGSGGHITHGGSVLFPMVSATDGLMTNYPEIRANCTGRDCTLAWSGFGQILAAPMLDDFPTLPIVAAIAPGLRPILFTGTTADPRMLIYARNEGQSYRIFVRSTGYERRRAVRH